MLERGSVNIAENLGLRAVVLKALTTFTDVCQEQILDSNKEVFIVVHENTQVSSYDTVVLFMYLFVYF
jgi:hypothetical protein